MRRPGILFWTAAVFVAGSGLFYMKHRVQTLEDQLTATNRKLATEQDAIHVLKAEWAYLTRPDRLARLNRKYLGLVAPKPEQLSGFEEIPPRTPSGEAAAAGFGPRKPLAGPSAGASQ